MAAAAICATQLFLCVPLQVYFSNLDELDIAFVDLIKLLLVPGIALFLLLFGLGAILPRKITGYFTALLAACSVSLWLQSNLMLWDYGLLDGRMIDWGADTWRGWLDGLVWLALITAAITSAKRFGGLLLKTAGTIVVVQLLAIIINVFQYWPQIKPSNFAEKTFPEALYGFSSGHNILHLMLDGFQSDVFSDLLNHPKIGGFYRNAFSGFTYYPETLGVFPYTRFAVPAFLGAKFYGNEMPQDDFVDSILGGDNIINTAADKGYEIDIGAGGAYLEKHYAHLRHDNLYNLGNDGFPLKEAAKIVDLGLFRALPHFAKPFIYNRQNWRLAPLFASSEAMQYEYFKGTLFLHKLAANLITSRNSPIYKYIHVMNTHNPMVVSANCAYAGGALPVNRENLTAQSKCTLDSVIALLQKMKALGIYDDALIVMHSDHGGWVAPHRQAKSRKITDGNGEDSAGLVTSLASPLLAIKMPGQQGELQVSKKYAWLADIPDTISDIMHWDKGFGQQSLLHLAEGQVRPRYFRFYSWRENEWDTKYAATIQEFLVEGSHYEVEWKLIRSYGPPED